MLDLSRSDVQQYLFNALNTLLSDYPISYLKWDMNRAIHQPGNSQGRAAVHSQTQALYQLLAKIRKAYPQLEIESCASGVVVQILAYCSIQTVSGPQTITML